jgi:toxin ParE1/3/4
MMSLPEPLPIELSVKARQDFVDILRYTGEHWGHAQLEAYRDKLSAALGAISRNPQLGSRRDDLPMSHRAYWVGSHVVVYRIMAERLGVVRILHQRMCVIKHIG